MPCEMMTSELKTTIRKIQLVAALEGWDTAHAYDTMAPYMAELERRESARQEQVRIYKSRKAV